MKTSTNNRLSPTKQTAEKINLQPWIFECTQQTLTNISWLEYYAYVYVLEFSFIWAELRQRNTIKTLNQARIELQ